MTPFLVSGSHCLATSCSHLPVLLCILIWIILMKQPSGTWSGRPMRTRHPKQRHLHTSQVAEISVAARRRVQMQIFGSVGCCQAASCCFRDVPHHACICMEPIGSCKKSLTSRLVLATDVSIVCVWECVCNFLWECVSTALCWSLAVWWRRVYLKQKQ